MNHEVSGAQIEQIEIDRITVGERRRKKLGGIQSLANSINAHGLVHPILIRNGCELVSGQRRLEACKRLGWRKIPIRAVDELTDEELRAIELDENSERLALADFESSKERLAQIWQAEAALKAKAVSAQPAPKLSKRGRKEGRPPKAGSDRSVEEATGISRREVDRIESHVALAEQHPFMRGRDWVQSQVLKAGKILEEIPETEHAKIAGLLDQSGIPPKKALEILQNIKEMPTANRKTMYQLAESDSPHDRETALTIAAAVPPPPDPALNRLREAKDSLTTAAKVCVTDDFKERIRLVRDLVIELERDFTAFQRSKNGKKS